MLAALRVATVNGGAAELKNGYVVGGKQASVGDADSCGARGEGTARATAIALAISAAFVGQFLLSQHCCLPACTTQPASEHGVRVGIEECAVPAGVCPLDWMICLAS